MVLLSVLADAKNFTSGCLNRWYASLEVMNGASPFQVRLGSEAQFRLPRLGSGGVESLRLCPAPPLPTLALTAVRTEPEVLEPGPQQSQ